MRGAVRVLAALVAVLVLGPGLSVAGGATHQQLAATGDQAWEEVARAAGVCSELDPADCLLPFPSDEFTVPDETTPTGLRVELSPLATPRNLAGKPIDPTEWNRQDGWSPGSMLLTHVPGLNLGRTFGIDGPVLEQPSLSLAEEAPIVLVDADTGERHPYLAEVDRHPETSPADRLLIVRPLVNFTEGHRYVIGLRNLRNGGGNVVDAGEEFAVRRDAYLRGGRGEGPPSDDPVLSVLERAGVDVSELYLAWDFTIASPESLAGRALAIRDQAFAQLGDTDLADGELQGRAPEFLVDEVIEQPNELTAREVHGRIIVPNFLNLPQDLGDPPAALTDALEQATEPLGDASGLPLDDLPPQMVPGSRLVYEAPSPGPTDTPVQSSMSPTLEAEFTCHLPATATASEPAHPTLYGHGLLGSRGEAGGSSTREMRGDNFAVCAVDWLGMSEEDILNVATILVDASNFPTLADRAQQGFLNFLYLGRVMTHPEGFAKNPAFQDADGQALLRSGDLYYDGNSQGGIMGGALAALSPDFTRAVLGVPGINYSTLLHRSVDWEGPIEEGVPVGYSTGLYTAYPDKQEQLIIMALIQMLWDRAEGNAYAQHMTDDPLPNTPAHRVLLHAALGDYQVADLAAEVEARTIGARFLQTALGPDRHWADEAGERLFGHAPFGLAPDGSLAPHLGSALVYWDSGNPLPPSANLPPKDLDEDPHGDPRKDPAAQLQKRLFYLTGEVVDVHDGEPYWTFECPRHPATNPGC